MKLGLFGGSFDPIHFGHLILAREALEQLVLDRVVFIPASVSPFKLGKRYAPAEHRLAMVRRAIANEPGFDVSECDLLRNGPSYTVDTVRAFQLEFPSAELHWFIGADHLSELKDWHEIDALQQMVRFVVLSRGPDLTDCAFPVVRRQVDISSTDIRNRVAQGRSIRYLLPMSACELIQKNGLYLHD